MMTRKELFEIFRTAAGDVYDDREALAVASLLLDEVAGVTRTDLFLSPDAPVPALDGMDDILTQLRAGRPVQYILGRCDFCGLSFAVREGVLIPRPETEELVEWVARENPDAIAVLDIGTGSGAIAVALALKIEGAEVHATDISDAALAVAHENASANRADVFFSKADILAPKEEWEGEWREGVFDVVVSNPPYIPSGDLANMHRNVKDFEPHIALFVPDDDPLLFYRTIAESALWLLADGGRLYFEIYEEFADAMRELLGSLGFSDIEVRQDINGKNRMVRCRKR